jgi:hypothetical protein
MKILNWVLLIGVLLMLGMAIWRSTNEGKKQNSGMDVGTLNTGLIVMSAVFGAYIIFNMLKK